ncbi:MAG: hypothetical protein A7316_02305 [Candidatus Altiarchaeales archaeon WOR_SM1_86-2]|nr:MAG: hypothetical protein A7316_02305 [Candidatus Altiarchaeales archaeon WOR_SM1_86-2]
MLRLTSDLRRILKKPLGRVTNISELVKSLENKGDIICVGDETSKLALDAGLRPKICVCDGKIRRKFVGIPEIIRKYAGDGGEIRVGNPPSYLTGEAFDGVQKALESGKNTVIFVDGEEDLITLAAIKLASRGTTVLYGQPDEGLVVVEVDDEIKDAVNGILDDMESSG